LPQRRDASRALHARRRARPCRRTPAPLRESAFLARAMAAPRAVSKAERAFVHDGIEQARARRRVPAPLRDAERGADT
jgi:hypothetical protein